MILEMGDRGGGRSGDRRRGWEAAGDHVIDRHARQPRQAHGKAGAGGPAREVRRDGVRVLLAVVDRGPGIPRAMQDRIFEPFVRLDEGRARSQGGTGLGLAIAREIARVHGGELTYEDRPGGGALFSAVMVDEAGIHWTDEAVTRGRPTARWGIVGHDHRVQPSRQLSVLICPNGLNLFTERIKLSAGSGD